MTGYVVVFEGDDQAGYSAYSPELPGVVAAGGTRQETEGRDAQHPGGGRSAVWSSATA